MYRAEDLNFKVHMPEYDGDCYYRGAYIQYENFLRISYEIISNSNGYTAIVDGVAEEPHKNLGSYDAFEDAQASCNEHWGQIYTRLLDYLLQMNSNV